MQRSSYSSTYLLRIALVILTVVQLTTTDLSLLKLIEECHEMSKTSQCSCTYYYTITITCTNDDVIKYDDNVLIYCNNTDPRDFSFLPKMTIGAIPKIIIYQCSLLPLQSIRYILQRLGITQVNTVKFQNDQLNGSLNRIHFEGLEGIDKLYLNLNDLSTIPEDTFMHLKNLKRLNLHSNKIRLSQNLFAPLETVTYINLNNNNLHNIPPRIFHNQKKLKHLHLPNNTLTNLTKDAFEGASAVTKLYLNRNNIVTLPPDVFTLLTSLEIINLDENYFNYLPVGLFSANKNLARFSLYNNRVPMKELPSGLFADMPNLGSVHLGCGLDIIPQEIFSGLKGIRNITISGNNLTKLPNKLFEDQVELLEMDLSRNQLISLPSDIFKNTRNLLQLELSYNRLRSISNELFNSLTNLTSLYMDNNNLLHIEAKAFANNQKLTNINMENNQLTFDEQFELIPEFPFHYAKQLRILNLRNNSIRNIFDDWNLNMPELHFLDLSYNKITKIVINDLWFIKQYMDVDLTHNSIRTINLTAIDFHPLKDQQIRIAISDNPLHCDCSLLLCLDSLSKKAKIQLVTSFMDSSDNIQCNTPQSLKGRLVIEISPEQLLCPLDGAHSSKNQCPPGCSCLMQLFDSTVTVNCSNGEFKKIPTLPVIFRNRTVLHIENNKLKELPLTTIPEYRNVKEIHAANNSLTTISVDNLPSGIESLDVSYNKLQNLNIDVLKFFIERQTTVNLSHNPWDCDCTSKNLVQFTQTNHKLIPDHKDMICENGEKFSQLSPEVDCPIRQSLVVVVSILICVVGVSLITLTILYYKYQQEIKIWLYAHNMCQCFVTEEELDKDKKYDAFVSYSHKDEDFIMEHLLPELENGPTPFNLCLHIRDWVVGDFIPDQIMRSVDDSRRTIIVLSPNFIESIWAQMEFRTAHTASLNEGRTRVIVIIYSDIGNIDTLDPDLKAYLQMNTYVKWGDPWFWDKLRYALPHRTNNPAGIRNFRHDQLELTTS